MCSFIYKERSSKLWECGNPAVFAGFPRTVERVGSLLLAFHAFHGPAFPQLILHQAVFLLSSVCQWSAGSDTIPFRSPEYARDL
jgi:hypothetical protein